MQTIKKLQEELLSEIEKLGEENFDHLPYCKKLQFVIEACQKKSFDLEYSLGEWRGNYAKLKFEQTLGHYSEGLEISMDILRSLKKTNSEHKQEENLELFESNKFKEYVQLEFSKLNSEIEELSAEEAMKKFYKELNRSGFELKNYGNDNKPVLYPCAKQANWNANISAEIPVKDKSS